MKKETETTKKLSSHAACFLYDQINQAQSPEQLDQLAKLMWQGHGEGEICDEDATVLDETIRRRRPLSRITAPGFHRSIGPIAGRIGSKFKSRRHQHSPNPAESIRRRRRWAAASPTPKEISGSYTEGQRAVLGVIASVVKRQGVCDWPLDRIAAIAGVTRSTVKNALNEAVRLGHVRVERRPVLGRKSLTNVVRITSPTLLAWIRGAPSVANRIGVNLVSPTKNIERKQEERKKEATEKEVRRGSKIPGEFVFVDATYRGKVFVPSARLIQSPSGMGSLSTVIGFQGLKKGRMRAPKTINIQQVSTPRILLTPRSIGSGK